MKYKTAFRLALKAIGVWLVAQTIESLPWSGSLYVDVWRDPTKAYTWQSAIPGTLSDVLGIGIGLYLFFGAKWLVNLAIPSNRPYCHECGYELTGNVSGVCPECGTAGQVPPGASEPRS
ncbi:MAG TPA: hypothetical protein VM487_24920 [Phycisphaerae bacterium]|nr:hypothetical protein [Phycisphaerae bacterium]